MWYRLSLAGKEAVKPSSDFQQIKKSERMGNVKSKPEGALEYKKNPSRYLSNLLKDIKKIVINKECLILMWLRSSLWQWMMDKERAEFKKRNRKEKTHSVKQYFNIKSVFFFLALFQI